MVGIPRLAFEVPLGKPQLFGGAVKRTLVEDTHHGGDGLVTSGVALEPVHHVAAEGPAHSADTVRIDVRKLDQFVGDLHQVFKHLATVISGNFSREILAMASGSTRIGERDEVAGAGINLPVTAKRILPLLLRPTVHVENEWILFGRIEVVGLDKKNFDLRPAGALNPHSLGRTEVHLIDNFVVEVREALRCRGFAVDQVHRKNFDRVADGTPGVEDAPAVMGEFEGVDGPVHQHSLNGAGVKGHAEDGIVAFNRSVKVQRFRV